jgi:DNA helicase-2/ATP-dependent DNA helicase PcrA
MSKSKAQYEAAFQAEYHKLNPEQREAVDTIYGPVMVVAGPGTGKTQILALRIANLLRSDAQVAPQNILCLTYTDEGKKNMRDRLFRLVGAETAQYIQVHSYHSFCNEIIQQNLSLFHKDELEPISELEKIQYIKQILTGLKKGNRLYNPKNPSSNAKYLLNLVSKMKQENWTSQYLNKHIHEYIEKLKTDPSSISSQGKTKGKIKVDVQKSIESYEKTLDAIKLFDEYASKMNEHHRYDFDDMINWVISLFDTNQDILWAYQERYQYLLVDEFQDTNGSQMKLIDLLCNYDPSPNVFVVGDDDQSIYRFQGASIENLQQFQHKYEQAGLKEICLKTNYRSPQGVLNYAKNLIECAEQRLVNTNPNLDKNLISHLTQSETYDANPKLLAFHNPRYEKIYIANEIKKRIEQGVKPSEIAVLYADNDSCLQLAEYLKKLNIPYYSRKQLNLLNETLAIQVINILRYIDAERSNPYSADHLLFEILHYQFFNISSLEIAKASILSYQKASENRSQQYSFRRYLQELCASSSPTLFDTTASDSLMRGARILEVFIKKSFNLSLLQLLDDILQECNIIQYVLQSDDKFEHLESLTAFFDFVKDECHRHTEMGIHELVDLIDVMQENDIVLPLTRLYGHEDAVRLFTVHASKGREFDYVFLAGLTKEKWEKHKNPPGLKFPPTVFESALSVKDFDELRRMIYVALTRAKKELTVSYFNIDSKGKENEKSQFLYEIFGDKPEEIKPHLSNEMIVEFETIEPEVLPEVKVKAIEKEYVDRQLQGFELNVTALNNYLKCPLHFYYNTIIKIPSAMAENMSLGSAVHYALEKLFSKMKEQNKVFPDKEFVIDMFKHFMRRNKEKFSVEGFAQKLEYGIDILSNLYDERVNQWHKFVDVEYKISAMMDNEIPIKGFLDKVEYHSQNEITVVDYKTGDLDSDYHRKKLAKGKPETSEKGGDYWRQAIFYKLLFDYNKTKSYTVREAMYEFVEPSKKTNKLPEPVYFSFQKEEVDMVKDQIKDTWAKIQQHDFYTGCGEKDCEWCNLSRNLG